jgi:amidase
MIPLAYGTQTTGSVIRPAAFCGAIGYKPTYGDFNSNGVMPNSPSIDTLGAMVRSVEDLALVRSVLLEEPLAALKPPSMRDLRIGFYRSPFWNQAQGYTQSHLERAAGRLSGMGARVTDLELPGIDAGFENLFRPLSGFEFARTVSWERFNRLGELSAALRDGRMKDGLETTYDTYRKMTRRLERMRLEIDDLLDGYDVLITPTAPGEPPKGLSTTGNAVFNSVWTALGTPAVTLPLFQGPTGLPVGLQLVAGRFKDRRLFDIADAVMKALG